MPWLISDLITVPPGMFFLFGERHDDGWLPRRLRLLSHAKLSDSLRVFLYLAHCAQSLSRAVIISPQQRTTALIRLQLLFTRTFATCKCGLKQKRGEDSGPQTCYVSLLYLPLTRPHARHANAPHKISSKSYC